MSMVLDNAVLVGWVITSQATEYGKAVATAVRGSNAYAPSLLICEYIDVLRTACKRENVIAQEVNETIGFLQNLPIFYDADVPDAMQIFALAIKYDLSSYDASYLELALCKQLPIATQDKALAQATRTAGVAVFEPLLLGS